MSAHVAAQSTMYRKGNIFRASILCVMIDSISWWRRRQVAEIPTESVGAGVMNVMQDSFAPSGAGG
jgi:hypothetical protein